MQPQQTRLRAVGLTLLWPWVLGCGLAYKASYYLCPRSLFSSFEPLHAWMSSVWGVHANTVFPG